mmetsp:Transcript_21898/g.86930  ORF Transcript_21898/g.86930 Transcript_21898/m.86930 type:complete len:212 (-) Transcript_21898:8-643(-)
MRAYAVTGATRSRRARTNRTFSASACTRSVPALSIADSACGSSSAEPSSFFFLYAVDDLGKGGVCCSGCCGASSSSSSFSSGTTPDHQPRHSRSAEARSGSMCLNGHAPSRGSALCVAPRSRARATWAGVPGSACEDGTLPRAAASSSVVAAALNGHPASNAGHPATAAAGIALVENGHVPPRGDPSEPEPEPAGGAVVEDDASIVPDQEG